MFYQHFKDATWHRLSRDKNSVSEEQRVNLLVLLRQIASSRTNESFQDAVLALQSSKVYKSNTKLPNCLQHYWLSIPERWCALHAGPGFEELITTNNLVEALNNSLKDSSLKLSGNGTLSRLVENVVEDFVECHWTQYHVQLNYEASSANRPYDQSIPNFLHNRPKTIVIRCHKSYVLSEYCCPEQIENMSDGQFLVKSENNDTAYMVYLGSEDTILQQSTLLKISVAMQAHFALMRNNFASWNDLPSHYRDSPYLSLDLFVLTTEVIEACRSTFNNDDDAVCPAAATKDTVPVEITEDSSTVASFLFSAQRKFREALKELVDLSYLCTDIDTLASEEKGLHAACEKLRRQVPTHSGLPVHQDNTVSRKLPTARRGRGILPNK